MSDKLLSEAYASIDVLKRENEELKAEKAKLRAELVALYTQAEDLNDQVNAIKNSTIAMLLWCPKCGERHIDHGKWATKPHKTHLCACCGLEWSPSRVPTVGVQFLPEKE